MECEDACLKCALALLSHRPYQEGSLAVFVVLSKVYALPAIHLHSMKNAQHLDHRHHHAHSLSVLCLHSRNAIAYPRPLLTFKQKMHDCLMIKLLINLLMVLLVFLYYLIVVLARFRVIFVLLVGFLLCLQIYHKQLLI